MGEIYTFNNQYDLWFYTCWSNFSLANSQFNHGGGLVFWFQCDYTEQQQEYAVFEMKNCTFDFIDAIYVFVSHSQSVEIRLTACLFTNPNCTISGINLIDITAEPTPTEWERNGVKVVLHNVTIEDVHSPGSSPSLLSLSYLQQVEFTDVHIQNNEIGAL